MVERNHSIPVQGVYREDMFGDDVPPGAFKVNEEGTHILCMCPCGCGSMMNLPIRSDTSGRPSWEWNGNREAPTLSPSIRDVGGCRFHGFLHAGVWTFTGDSGQS